MSSRSDRPGAAAPGGESGVPAVQVQAGMPCPSETCAELGKVLLPSSAVRVDDVVTGFLGDEWEELVPWASPTEGCARCGRQLDLVRSADGATFLVEGGPGAPQSEEVNAVHVPWAGEPLTRLSVDDLRSRGAFRWEATGRGERMPCPTEYGALTRCTFVPGVANIDCVATVTDPRAPFPEPRQVPGCQACRRPVAVVRANDGRWFLIEGNDSSWHPRAPGRRELLAVELPWHGQAVVTLRWDDLDSESERRPDGGLAAALVRPESSGRDGLIISLLERLAAQPDSDAEWRAAHQGRPRA